MASEVTASRAAKSASNGPHAGAHWSAGHSGSDSHDSRSVPHVIQSDHAGQNEAALGNAVAFPGRCSSASEASPPGNPNANAARRMSECPKHASAASASR